MRMCPKVIWFDLVSELKIVAVASVHPTRDNAPTTTTATGTDGQ
jgi:hypothetical protein